MGGPRNIDWEAIEREYRLGQFSIREIALRYEVSHSSILRRAAKGGWTQDKSAEVKARVRARLLLPAPHEPRTAHHAPGNAPSEAAIEDAVDLRVSIHVEHQRAARDFRVIIGTLGDELRETTAFIGQIEEDIEDETRDDKTGERRARMLRAVSLPTRATTAGTLTGALKNAVSIERQAHNMDTEPDKEPDGITVELVRFSAMSDE